MDKVIVASMHENAGKTSVIVGLAKALGKSFSYVKPFGDRLLYKKKRLWDYDSALLAGVFELEQEPEDLSIGFDHSKLRYMYNEEQTSGKLRETVANIGQGKEIVFVEAGKYISYGKSVYLDALSLTKYLEGKLIIVFSGDEDTIVDDITFLKKHVDMGGINLGGVIINQVQRLDDFKATRLGKITEMGIKVLGVVPYQVELTYCSVNYLAKSLFAKVITGENGLSRIVKNIVIGAWSANIAIQSSVFKKESKLLITGGDRIDMILAGLESDTAGIILTNNILPSPNIISQAEEHAIPLLLVPYDTYETARRIDRMAPLLTQEDTEKIGLLERLMKNHVDIQAIA